MTDSNKLLFIFPDVAYTAELLSSAGTKFSLKSFHQVNGLFVTEDGFIKKNIDKLFSRLNKTEYQLVLPDYLFTNTIVSVEETEDERIAAYLKNSLLPSLNINTHDFYIDTTILTTFKDKAKVQLAAIEKPLLTPISVFAEKHGLNITSVSPITWALKSVVSLEPSISLVQVGEFVYAGLHYIGVDQTNHAKLSQLEILAETIKTLKGSEPNIQTIYLISNTLVENKLKEVLSTTLPVQQLVTDRNDNEKIPSYLKFALEAAARTLSINDYPVPRFKLDAPTEEEKNQIFEVATQEKPPKELPKEAKENQETSTAVVSKPKKLDLTTNKTLPTSSRPTSGVSKQVTDPPSTRDEQPPLKKELNATQTTAAIQTKTTTKTDVDISQFAYNNQSQETPQTQGSQEGGKKMLKMIFITLAVFFATVAVGVGVGFGLLTLTNKNKPQENVEVAVLTPTATPTEAITPTKAAELKPISVLVANATKKSGYAGNTKRKLLKADEAKEKRLLKKVAAANAKDTYQAPNDPNTQLLLMKEENDAVKTALEELSGFKLKYADGIKTEDPADKYDAVIVLVQ